MTEAELDRLRRELPALVGRVVEAADSILSRVEHQALYDYEPFPDARDRKIAKEMRDAMDRLDREVGRTGVEEMLAQAMRAAPQMDTDGHRSSNLICGENPDGGLR